MENQRGREMMILMTEFQLSFFTTKKENPSNIENY